MKLRWNYSKLVTNPVIIRWETRMAEYLQIELSPTHLFRIKVDKDKTKGKQA